MMWITYEPRTSPSKANAIRQRLWGKPAPVKLVPRVDEVKPVIPAPMTGGSPKAPPKSTYRPRDDADAHVWDWRDHLVKMGAALTVIEYLKVRCRQMNVQYADIIGPSRKRIFVGPRQLLMCEVHERYPELSLTQIGRRFGNRDHTTVLHAWVKYGHVTAPRRKVTKDMEREMFALRNAGVFVEDIAERVGIHVCTVREYLHGRATAA